MTGEAPLVSVAIPAFNARRTLPQTLDSVLAQDYPRFEVIVVDDGSTDGTQEALEPYRARVRVIRQDNGGLPKARNTAWRHAEGELVALMDADDLCAPERLRLQVQALADHPDAVLCSSDFSAFDTAGEVSASHAARYYSSIARAPEGLASLYPHHGRLGPAAGGADTCFGSVYRALVLGNFVHPPTVMVRRGALERAGGFDEQLRYNCDWECFVRLARLGPFVHVKRPLLRYRLSESQMSSSSANHGRGALEMVAAARKMRRADPALFASLGAEDAAMRAGLYLDAAYALSERRKAQAARMLALALGCGADLPTVLRVAARVAAPRALLGYVRRARAHGAP